MLRTGLALILLLILIPLCNGAIVHGIVYNWEDLKPLPKAVIVVNSTPEQRIVTQDGSYSFNLPPGNYVIKAYYYKNGKVVLYAEDNVTIKRNGSYVVDLILFPTLNFNTSQPKVEFDIPSQNSGSNNTFLVFFIVFATSFSVVFLYLKRRSYLKRQLDKSNNNNVNIKLNFENLPEDLKEALREIVNSGGRITQKELRNRLKYSEAKVSLIISDLERRGIVEKVKKGRGNIIFLKDEYKRILK